MIFVDKEKCIGCKRCALVCPVRVLEIKEDMKSEVVRKDFCIRCGHCINICPTEALTSDFNESVKGIPYASLNMPSYDQVESFMLTRRSIRAYDKKEVKKEDIEKILRVAAHAPTACNAQNVKFIVVASKKLDELGKLADNFWKAQINDNVGIIAGETDYEILLGAPVTIALCAEKNNEGDLNQALWNCLISAQSLLLAAHGMGFGGCYNGLLTYAYRNDEDLQQFFSLPENQQIYMFVVLGYPHPDIKYINTIERLKPCITWK